jgi:peptide/nickel transport system substrate-binding protein
VSGAVLLASCTSSTGTEPPPATQPTPAPVVDPTPRPGGVLRVASGPLPADWSPAATVWDTSALQVARGLYDRLAVYDANNVPVPQLAESFGSDPGFTRWVLRLRRGILFQDGTPLDAAAVVANLEAQRSSPVGRELLQPITAVVAADSRTVVVTTATPWSTFPEVLATQIGFIASPATLVAGGLAPPVGTGPFRYATVDPALATPPFSPGEVRLERNPFYWQSGLPYLDGVTFPVSAESGVRVSQVLSGAADLVAADRPNPIDRLERAASSGTVRVIEDRNAEAPKVVVAFNTGRAPFDEISARRASALATDRAQLAEDALGDQGIRGRGVISDPSPWYTDLPEPIFDVPRARAEERSYVEEFGTPIAAELLVPTDPFLLYVAALWRAQQEEAGIAITIRPVSPAELTDLTRRGQYQAAMMVAFTSPHPDLYEPLFRGIPGEQPSTSINITRYVEPVVTDAFAEARATSDVAVQVDRYRIIQEQLYLDLPWLFLLQLRQVVAVVPAVRDVDRWFVAGGGRGLGQDGATVSLAQIWLDRDAAAVPSTTTTAVVDEAVGPE